jgi:hypothetical protein
MSHLVASIQIEISVVVLLLVQDLGQLLSLNRNHSTCCHSEPIARLKLCEAQGPRACDSSKYKSAGRDLLKN